MMTEQQPASQFSPRTVRLALIAFFAVGTLLLLWGTVRASLVRGVLDNGALLSDVWFQVTLIDTYLAFMTIFLWIAWKERTPLRGVVWLILIATLGNFAIGGYLIWQLVKLPPGKSVADLLIDRAA